MFEVIPAFQHFLCTCNLNCFNHSKYQQWFSLSIFILVEDKNTVDFICNKTAAPYFSNLVWFIGNHVLQLDICLEQNSE